MRIWKVYQHVTYKDWLFVPEVFLSNGAAAGIRYKEEGYPRESTYIVEPNNFNNWTLTAKSFD